MRRIQNELHSAGYVVSPNNSHSLQGVIMYAGGPGIPEPQKILDVQVTNDRIRIFRPQFFGEAYSRESWWDTVTVAVFTSVPTFLDWCREHGQISKPGIVQPSWID